MLHRRSSRTGDAPAGPSRTARAVATARALGAGGHRDPLAAIALPARLAAVVGVAGEAAARSPAADALLRLATGGLTVHAVRRQRAIDAAVVAAVRDGCRQLVTVGAGYDTRPWRLAALADVVAFEVDRAVTQTDKRARLHGHRPRGELRFVPADLAVDDLSAALAQAGHDPAVPTVWVWEAVTMYLPSPAVAATLTAIAGRSAPGSRLAVTYLTPSFARQVWLDRVVRRPVQAAFAARGEPLLTTFSDAEIGHALARAGFVVDRLGDLRDQVLRGPTGPDPFAAERLALAVRVTGEDGAPDAGRTDVHPAPAAGVPTGAT